jgi:hypothetical protein
MPWQKGQSGNLKGRPANPAIDELRKALARAKKRQGVDFLDHFVDLAYKDTACAIALAKKLLPDVSSVKQEIAGRNGAPIPLQIVSFKDVDTE